MIDKLYQKEETIAALATPPGEGGVAIVRISGPRAIDIAEAVFSGSVSTFDSHTAHYGWIVDRDGKRVDDGLCLVFRGSRSYTGEDSVELQCHGGSLVSRRVLETVLAAGARAAAPGEFTYRAYSNGRLDLAQAEAVQELIGAKNELALQAAQERLNGRLSDRIVAIQKELIDLTAILEAWVDFPEEGLEYTSMEAMQASLRGIMEMIQTLLSTFHDGRMIQEGVSLSLIGSPNVGKSSLLNALVDRERAIVTHIAGTTRDLLEESIRLGELHVKLVDTAGIRETTEVVEQEGIRRSLNAMEQADLVLFLVDASRDELSVREEELLRELDPERTIVVWNKNDLQAASRKPCSFSHQISLSAKEGQGIEQLKELIQEVIWKEGPPSQEEIMISSLRHKEALEQAKENLNRLYQGLATDTSPEFLTLDARGALRELASIIGQDITESILSSIFSRFCIGK